MVQGSNPSFSGHLCSDRNTFLRAAGARSEIFFHYWFLFIKTVPTTYRTVKSVHASPFLYSERNTFSHTAGARRAWSKIFFHHWFLFTKTVPTRYRTAKSVHASPFLCSERNTCCDRFYSKTVPTSYRTPKSVQGHPKQLGTKHLLLYR